MIPEISVATKNQSAPLVHVIDRKMSDDINYSKTDSKIANNMIKSCNAI